MKKLFFLLATLTILTSSLKSQLYRNEWINYEKTYYKFKVGPFGFDIVGAPIRTGLVRINQPVLVAAGLGNIPAEQFQLWRDGQEVPLYVSKSSGVLSPTDYVEFFGEIANGKTDKDLYANPDHQLGDIWNLSTDSAAYFLTVNTSSLNKRIADVANNLAGNTREPEKNFYYTVGRYYRGFIYEGFGVDAEGFRLNRSTYDQGEGFTSRAVHANDYWETGTRQMPQNFPSLFLDTTGPAMTAKFNMVGGGGGLYRDVKVLMNNDSLTQFALNSTQYIRKAISDIPANKVKTDNVTFIVQNSPHEADNNGLRVATIELEYPRKFNFGGASTFEFYIAPSETGRYLKITNFSSNGSIPVLIDLGNNTRYIANTNVTDTLQFLLQPSTEKYHLVLARADGSTAKTINTLQQRQFKNYLQAQNQGNYLIVTNPFLMGTGPQDNYVQQYSDYRSSDSGGNYKVQVVDINDLIDQFAYGVDMHPLSIKNFLRFARNNFSEKPAYAFLIGKGLSYSTYRIAYYYDPLTVKLNLVPVFGSPGSDNLLSADGFDAIPQTPIGRLSAVTPAEVGGYLNKVKEYESAQRDTVKQISERLWLKKAILIAGANDPIVGKHIIEYNQKYSQILKDTLGAEVYNYNKTADPSGYPQALLDFTSQYNMGCGLLEYFGHSSSSSIDFSLDNPANYSNGGKYPLFIVNGCKAGNIFDYDVNRFNSRSTISEKFMLEPGKGAIGYLSSSSYGEAAALDGFTTEFNRSISTTQYGKGFGNVVKEGITNALKTDPAYFYFQMLAGQFTFHGDPAIKVNSFDLPDYAIDSAEMQVTPGYLTVASDSFDVKIVIRNLGRISHDSVHLTIKRTFPDQSSTDVFNARIAPVYSKDSLTIKLPVVGNRDKGTSGITATVNAVDPVPEITTSNNTALVKVKISAADLLPVSPYNYSIVTTSNIDLVASSVTVFDSLTQYVMELDTTALFNSPVKISREVVSKRGLIEFTGIPLSLNNTVYYWRVSEDSADKHWNSFSFTYKEAGNVGFEQAHFYQHTQSSFQRILMDTASRSFRFAPFYNNLFIQHSIYPTSGIEDNHFSVAVNGTAISASACVGHSIIFNIFEPVTFKPVLNTTLPYGSGGICRPSGRYNFEYSTQSAATRKNAMDFLDYFVSNGYYVVARKIYDQGDADWAPTVWTADTSIYGHNNSLYHRLKDQGTQIDSFTYPRTFVFIFKKNDSNNYKTKSVFSQGLYDRISISENIAVSDTVGYVSSPLFGPGKAWNKVLWHGAASNSNNKTTLDIFGVSKDGTDSLFYTIDTSLHEYDISAINATEYPFVQLRLCTSDTLTAQPYQLSDWTVEFDPVAEGAIAANIGSNVPDTLVFAHGVNVAFDTLKGYVVFKNISSTNFDSLKVKVVLFDENNIPYPFTVPKTRPLNAGDTLYISFLANVTALPAGKYNLFLEVNPDYDQPEQYHYNNFFYKYLVIKREVVLAARMFDLSANPSGGNVQLKWNITNEFNAAYYIVEHSMNGTNFNEVGKVNATQVTSLVKYYGFIHTSPNAGKNFYRIKMVMRNGDVAYTPVRIVVMESISIQVYPNPFKDQVKVVMSGNDINGALRMLDLSGRVLLQQKFTGSVILNAGKISAGIYLLQVNDGATMHSFKVYKQ